MIVIEFKLKGKDKQFRIVDEMIRTAQFVRNKALRYWLDNSCVKLSDLYKQCGVLAHEFEWAGKLNSMARQAAAERAIFAIQRFFANCKAKKSGLKMRDFGGNNSSRNSLTRWGLSESAVCRLIQKVESLLIKSGEFCLPGKKQLDQNA